MSLYYLNIIIHLLAAFSWLGGMLFLAVVGSAGFWDRPYGRALLWKLLAVAGMVAGSFIHDFVLRYRATRAEQGWLRALHLRRRAAMLARFNALLGIVAVGAAVCLARGTP